MEYIDKLLFCFHFDLFEKLKMCDFRFLKFSTQLQNFKCSESVVSENKHALPENIVLMYHKVFYNSKFKFSRKCKNKSVCVRRFLRCMCKVTVSHR